MVRLEGRLRDVFPGGAPGGGSLVISFSRPYRCQCRTVPTAGERCLGMPMHCAASAIPSSFPITCRRAPVDAAIKAQMAPQSGIGPSGVGQLGSGWGGEPGHAGAR